MIAHEHVSEDVYLKAFLELPKDMEKGLAVMGGDEDVLSIVSTGQNMVVGAFKLYSPRSGHDRSPQVLLC